MAANRKPLHPAPPLQLANCNPKLHLQLVNCKPLPRLTLAVHCKQPTRREDSTLPRRRLDSKQREVHRAHCKPLHLAAPRRWQATLPLQPTRRQLATLPLHPQRLSSADSKGTQVVRIMLAGPRREEGSRSNTASTGQQQPAQQRAPAANAVLGAPPAANVGSMPIAMFNGHSYHG